jgi:hypothetical protein
VEIVDDRLDGGAQVHARFEVEGLQMSAGEVLHGCRVAEITPSGILFESLHADGIIMSDTSTKQLAGIIAKNMIIPVTVVNTSYPICHKKMTITGTLFVPPLPDYTVYKITTQMTDMEAGILAELYSAFTAELSAHKTTQNFTGASKIMYPFTTMRAIDARYKQFKPASEQDLKLPNLKPGSYVMVPPELSGELKLNIYTTDKFESDMRQIEASEFVALADFINKRLVYMQAVRGIAEQYNTPAKWTALNMYWQIIMALKNEKK